MSLFTQVNLPDWYYVSLINTKTISYYVDNFINNTSHFQINDARQLPIIIPNQNQLDMLYGIFTESVKLKKKSYETDTEKDELELNLNQLQLKLDSLIDTIYGIQ